MMKTVTICTPHATVRASLSERFAKTAFRVDDVATEEDLRKLLSSQKRDVVIIETRRESFANIMRFCVQRDPAIHVYLFWDDGIFCFYPASHQPSVLVDALLAVGLRLPPNLLKHARRPMQAELVPVQIQSMAQ